MINLMKFNKTTVSFALVGYKFLSFFIIYLFSDFVQSTRYIKQKDTSPLQGFST